MHNYNFQTFIGSKAINWENNIVNNFILSKKNVDISIQYSYKLHYINYINFRNWALSIKINKLRSN